MMQRAASFTVFGEPHRVVCVKPAPIPTPRKGHVVVKMHSRSVNHSDLLAIRGEGHYKNTFKPPKVPGFEGVGKVVARASDVTFPNIDQRVLALRGEGTWQEYAEIPAESAIPVPDQISDDQAAQIYINPMTAWLIRKKYLNKNDLVIGNAGGSQMSKLFAQFSKRFGYQYIAVTRSDDYTDMLKQLGATHVINYAKQPLLETILNLTGGRRPNIALEAVGGEAGARLAETVGAGGKVVIYGNLSLSIYGKISLQADVTQQNFMLREWVIDTTPAERLPVFNELMQFIIDNKIELPVAHKFDLSHVQDALKCAEQSHRLGKVLITSNEIVDNSDSKLKPHM